MPRPRNPQEFVHWLEVGEGARWIRTAATLLGVCVLSLLVAWKQFHGATSEATLVQADEARQLAAGQGFTTLVNYPQAVAFLEQRGVRFDARQPYPELHQAPLYAIVIAGALRLMPAAARASLFTSPPSPPDGFAADYFLLGLNVVLLWLAAWLTFDLARRLFDGRTAWLAGLAVLFSVGIWQQTVMLTGAPLLMVISLATFSVWLRADRSLAPAVSAAPTTDPAAPPPAPPDPPAGPNPSPPPNPTITVESAPTTSTSCNPIGYTTGRGGVQPSEGVGRGGGRRAAGAGAPYGWLAALGAGCGLLFLSEYSAGALAGVAVGYAVVRTRGAARWLAIGAVAAGFALVASPWVVRNVQLTGNPVALAAQNVALKTGDPTAEPATYRNTLSPILPSVNLAKLGNKTLTALQEDVKTRIWSGGAMWLMAFFVTAAFYRFRSPTTDRLRWTFVLSLGVLLAAQAALNSGETERHAAGWLAPLIIVFGAGFFFVLVGSNAGLGQWPRTCAAALLLVQALPLLHDVLEPRRLHFQYPPYFPGLFIGMRQELERRDHAGRFGIMADVPAGVAWYGSQRVWSQPVKLRDFYAVTMEQPLAELLLTPRTLDRPFFSELAARPVEPGSLGRTNQLFGEWGRIYAGLFTGSLPAEFPLSAPQKLAENLYVLLNPALPPPQGK